MDLTTTARVQAFKDWASDATRDAWLATAITAFSKAWEQETGRVALSGSYADYFTVDGVSAQVYRLEAFPVASITEVNNDPDRTFASATAVSSDAYTFDPDTGLVYVDDASLVKGVRALKVTYSGGMAADTNAFVTAYPDVALAMDEQVAWAYENRDRLGQATVQGRDGSVTLFREIRWVKAMQALIEVYRRRT